MVSIMVYIIPHIDYSPVYAILSFMIENIMRNPMKYLRIRKLRNGPEKGKPRDKRKLRRCDYVAPRVDRYWANPARMIGSFLAGIVLAVTHHVYYTQLNNMPVGSATKQQWPIRFGTAFAFLFKTCLANATGIAYMQWVWRQCRQQAVEVGAINAAFAVDRNIFTFFDSSFILKFPFATVLMLVFWCIPLSSLVAPATLGVTSKPTTSLVTVSVPRPTIGTSWGSFDGSSKFILLNQTFNALAATGEVIQFGAPANSQNISYTVDLVIPFVSCQVSDEVVQSSTAAAAYGKAIYWFKDPLNTSYDYYPQNLTFIARDTSLWRYIGYYSMVSKETNTGRELPSIRIAIANTPNIRDTELSSKFYSASYYTCAVLNASVTTNVSFVNNVLSLRVAAIRELEMNMTSQRYSGILNYQQFVFKLGSLISGFMCYSRRNNTWLSYLDMDTIEQTVFREARDLQETSATWDENRYKSFGDSSSHGKNLTTLIEEMSLNVSWSLMSNPLLNDQVPTQATQTLWVNRYTYAPKNLLIAYGCSIFACLITILAGGYAFYANDESYDSQFSSISKAMQSPDIAALFECETPDALSQEKTIAQTKIQLRGDGKIERFRVDAEHVALSST